MLKDERADSVAIGKRLGVNLVVEGDARLSGDRLVIRAALISVASGRALWSELVERIVSREGDLVALVDDLTRSIVDRLRLKLGRTQRRYETDLATYATYRRAHSLRGGRAYRATKRSSSIKKSSRPTRPMRRRWPRSRPPTGISVSSIPTSTAPTFPADCDRPPRAVGRDRRWRSTRSLQTRTRQSAYSHALALRWDEADASFRRAIDLEPTRSTLYSDYVLAVLLPSGRLDEAEQLLETALKRDPLSLDLRRVLARVQINAGRYDAGAGELPACDRTGPDLSDHERVRRLGPILQGRAGRGDPMVRAVGRWATIGRPGPRTTASASSGTCTRSMAVVPTPKKLRRCHSSRGCRSDRPRFTDCWEIKCERSRRSSGWPRSIRCAPRTN